MKNLKKIFVAVLLLSSVLLLPSFALAADTTTTTTNSSSLKSDITSKLKTTGQSASYDTSKEGEAALASIIGAGIKVILGLVGVILLGLIIFAGFKWMTAGGEAGEVQKAKDTLQRAIIGLVIIVAAYTIASFVMNKLTGAVGSGTSTTSTEDMTGLPF